MKQPLLLLAACLLPATLVLGQSKSARPNILYIMSDDHAAHAIRA